MDSSSAVCFPGIGVQLCGRERAFVERHAGDFEPFFKAAGDACGADLSMHLVDSKQRILNVLEEQYFFYAFSVGMWQVLNTKGILPTCLAGYSFGVYPALVAARVVSFEDGLAIVRRAFELASEASHGVAMAVQVGLKASEVDSILGAMDDDTLLVVNVNNETCSVVAGAEDAIDRFVRKALEHGAISAERLGIPLAFHHPRFFREAGNKLCSFLEEMNFRDAGIPIVASTDRAVLTRALDMRKYVADNLANPISWFAVMEMLAEKGVSRVIECGPGISLTQNGRFMPFDLKYINVKTARRKLGL